jgi:hypothetical protein
VLIAEPGSLPAGDRVAHLLVALLEDEKGFATVANLAFPGATWRVRRRMQNGRGQRSTRRGSALKPDSDVLARGDAVGVGPVNGQEGTDPPALLHGTLDLATHPLVLDPEMKPLLVARRH